MKQLQRTFAQNDKIWPPHLRPVNKDAGEFGLGNSKKGFCQSYWTLVKLDWNTQRHTSNHLGSRNVLTENIRQLLDLIIGALNTDSWGGIWSNIWHTAWILTKDPSFLFFLWHLPTACISYRGKDCLHYMGQIAHYSYQVHNLQKFNETLFNMWGSNNNTYGYFPCIWPASSLWGRW